MRSTLPAWIFATLISVSPLTGISQGQSEAVDDSDVIIGAAEIAYHARAGDTLVAIAARFTHSASNWVTLGHLNGISQNKRIAVNTVIHIPADLLLDQPVDARVVALSGVTRAISPDKTVVQLQSGSRVREGMLIETSGNSFVTLELFDASRISIPSNTLVRINTLRATRYTHSPRTAISIQRGSVESTVSPLKQNKGSFQILSPSASAAVRGTHFRVAVLADGSTAHALFDGVIELERRTAPEHLTLQPGSGNLTSAHALGAPVLLLAAPQLSEPPTLQETSELSLHITPLVGAVAYHVQLANDIAAQQPFVETRATTHLLTLGKVTEGDYSMRIAAINAAGIEGFSRVIPVSLHRQATRADNPDIPSAPWLGSVESHQFTLRWRSASSGGFRIQVARDSAFSWLQYNTTLSATELRLPRLPFGTYYARVQRQNRDGSFGPFSAVQAFVVTEEWIIPDGLPRQSTPSAVH